MTDAIEDRPVVDKEITHSKFDFGNRVWEDKEYFVKLQTYHFCFVQDQTFFI